MLYRGPARIFDYRPMFRLVVKSRKEKTQRSGLWHQAYKGLQKLGPGRPAAAPDPEPSVPGEVWEEDEVEGEVRLMMHEKIARDEPEDPAIINAIGATETVDFGASAAGDGMVLP